MGTPLRITYTVAEGRILLLTLSGSWRIRDPIPTSEEFENRLFAAGEVTNVSFDGREIITWDSALPIFLKKIKLVCDREGIGLDPSGLPEGAGDLLRLATTVPEREDMRREDIKRSFLVKVGTSTIDAGHSWRETLTFLGEIVIATGRFFRGNAQYLKSDLFLFIQESGAQALGIVGLISFLVGVILAFIGAEQLAMSGAEIYVANLVGLATVRAMAAIMTGIVLAGRTGASYAAQLGTMQVNEEIDALRTLGISPIEFLVMPRMMALILMTPLLCLYADLLGILGGAVVGIGLFGITPIEYYQQTRAAIPMVNIWVGLFQGAVYGVLVAVAGCLRGMQCGRSAWDVGAAATSAVVTGITWIIASCAVMTMIFNQLGI